MLFNAAGVVRFQILCATALAVSGILLKVALASIWGVAGVVWATFFTYILCCVIPAIIFLPMLFKELNARQILIKPA